MREAKRVLEIIRDRGYRGLPLERIYRLLYNPELYLMAYAKIAGNSGVLTPGVNKETVDGMNLGKIQGIIEALKYERYRFKPARRIYIEKENSKKLRPLGIPTWSDKLVQEVIRLILEAYYEPQFNPTAHGFRPNRGCHTALLEISNVWVGTVWFIEGDIKGCFDNLNHEVLINILSMKIKDNKFLRLISGLLKAGYMEQWKYNNTYSGTPQGAVLSPLFANIYLDKLDKFVETKLIPENTRGKQRARNQEYEIANARAYYAKKRGEVEKSKKWKQIARNLPSKDTKDPNYRRLRYVRYADDFILGFAGSKAEALEIKSKLQEFLREELRLEMSKEKTLVTHGRTGRANFLGHEISVAQNDTKIDQGGKRGVNGQIRLHVPVEKVNKFLLPYLLNGKPRRRPELLKESDYAIVGHFQTVYRGFAEYYKYAGDRSLRFKRVKRVMERSLVMTLANKHDSRVSKIYRKYGTKILTPKGQYKGLQVVVERVGKKPLVATWGGISLARVNPREEQRILVDKIHYHNNTGNELLKRLLADECELCGSQENVEVHHIRALKDLKKEGRKEPPDWVKRMSANNRKTLVVCHKCHQSIHHGKHDGIKTE
jgi:group II intron reverse transcriptase/maturase